MFRKKPEPAPETVACSTCGHIVLRSRATHALHDYRTVWFCSDHYPHYDECFSWTGAGTGAGGPCYYRRMRVSEFGIPIGYVKATE